VSSITPYQIAAADTTAFSGNGNALDLAALADAPLMNGLTYTKFYGQLGARVGRALSTARDDQQTQSLLLAQSKTLREELSGVNLDEEAANLIQYQRAYQAAAQMITVLNDLTAEVFTILR
jgi:flagellar hook-associated protein 1 FlgK